jgi:hypothetical protein
MGNSLEKRESYKYNENKKRKTSTGFFKKRERGKGHAAGGTQQQ